MWCSHSCTMLSSRPAALPDYYGVVALNERVPTEIERGAHVPAIAGVPICIHTKRAVESTSTIKHPVELPVDEHGANAGLFAQITADASDGKVGALAIRGIAGKNLQPGRAIVGGQKTE